MNIPYIFIAILGTVIVWQWFRIFKLETFVVSNTKRTLNLGKLTADAIEALDTRLEYVEEDMDEVLAFKDKG